MYLGRSSAVPRNIVQRLLSCSAFFYGYWVYEGGREREGAFRAVISSFTFYAHCVLICPEKGS